MQEETHIAVALQDDPCCYPDEVWDVSLRHLDMYTEEVLEELKTIAWAENKKYPSHSSISARSGVRDWGSSGSFSELLMQVSTGTVGGAGAMAIAGATKLVYTKLKSRSRGEAWSQVPTLERAVELASARIHQHYEVVIDELTVTRSDVDMEAQRFDIEFVHTDGRRFGATVGAITGMPWCTRIWSEGAEPLRRPEPGSPVLGD
ncbi:hypothetical protein ABZ764_02640 [Streptomyces pseudogriseolus]|uniref:hypothetical protein n=1 Tax=Streptomyces pseudogriseolus TaxID=36817 RepID=UPI00348925CF